jgi:hypothetical protein
MVTMKGLLIRFYQAFDAIRRDPKTAAYKFDHPLSLYTYTCEFWLDVHTIGFCFENRFGHDGGGEQ